MQKHRISCAVVLALIVLTTVGVSQLWAGFQAPPGGMTTIVDNALQFKGRVDYVAPGTGPAAWAGGVFNWDPHAQEAPAGGGMFDIDVTGRHSVAPHLGEVAPNVLMMIKLPNVVAGGPAIGPLSTNTGHADHMDWMQAILKPINLTTSRLYIQLDHLGAGIMPATIDPTTFDIPEPGAMAVMAVAMLAMARRRR
jgi:hypothetical protein